MYDEQGRVDSIWPSGAQRGRRERFLELLAKAPGAEPEEEDRLPDEPRR